MSAAGQVVAEGYTHEEFMAVSGLAPLPPIPASNKPLPMPYQQAVQAVTACLTLDEARYFASASEALSAWAKIYSDDAVAREARALKLHAYRRMGQLAKSVATATHNGKPGVPHSHKALLAVGLKHMQAVAAARLATVSQDEFNAAVNAPRIVSPATYYRRNPAKPKSTGFEEFAGSMRNNGMMFRGFVRKHKPEDLAADLTPEEATAALRIATEILNWITDFSDAIHARRRSAA